MQLEVSLLIAMLVYGAFIFKLFGFLARDELWLRLFMLVGSTLYLVYYYVVADSPLWDAIITNALLALTNLAMIIVVIVERTTIAMSPQTTALYQHFPLLSPGQFRRLLKAGGLRDITTPTILTEAGQPLNRLYFVIRGPVVLGKSGGEHRRPDPLFIGEVAFLTGNPASATVQIEPGAQLLEWDAARLRHLLTKSPALNVALGAQFNQDLVNKVARSIPA